MQGKFVKLTSNLDLVKLDEFEGSEYKRVRVQVQIQDSEQYNNNNNGHNNTNIEYAYVYEWCSDIFRLELDSEWDFGHFVTEYLPRVLRE